MFRSTRWKNWTPKKCLWRSEVHRRGFLSRVATDTKHLKASSSAAENLFLGQVNPEIFSLFQFNLEEKFPRLRGNIKQYSETLGDQDLRKTSSDVLTSLANLGCFRLRNDFTKPEILVHLEMFGNDLALSETISAANSFSVSGIETYGSDLVKEKYVQDLQSGKKLASVCLTDDFCGSDIGATRTTLKDSADNPDVLYLNGKKTWVSNGQNAEVFTVFANFKKEKNDEQGSRLRSRGQFSAVVVDKSMDGITLGQNMNSSGMNSLQCCEIYFNNTPVPRSHVLGDIGSGYDVYSGITLPDRMFSGAKLVSVLKSVLNRVIQRVRTKPDDTKSDFSQRNYSAHLIARMSQAIYTLESITYLAALHTDQVNIHLDSSIVRLYSIEATKIVMDHSFLLLGSSVYEENSWFMQLYQNLQASKLWEGNEDMVKLYIGLEAFRLVGKARSEEVYRILNKSTFLRDQLVELYRKGKVLNDSVRPKLALHNHVHPELKGLTDKLDVCIQKLSFGMKMAFFFNDGKNIRSKENSLVEAAVIGSQIYGLMANISRCNAALNLNLPNANFGVDIASMDAINVKKIMNEYLWHVASNSKDGYDFTYRRVADYLFNFGNYCLWHPMRRNKF